MAHSSHARSSISIDLFNLPSLLDKRRQTTMFCDFPNDFFLPDGKNSRLSQIVNKQIFGTQTPDGNEGVGVKIRYLEHAYGTKYYLVDQINGNINAIYNNNIEPTDFVGHFSPFDLEQLEFDIWRLADHCKGEDDSVFDEDRVQAIQETPVPQQPSHLKELHTFHELRTLTHDGKIFMVEQCTNLYFQWVE